MRKLYSFIHITIRIVCTYVSWKCSMSYTSATDDLFHYKNHEKLKINFQIARFSSVPWVLSLINCPSKKGSSLAGAMEPKSDPGLIVPLVAASALGCSANVFTGGSWAG